VNLVVLASDGVANVGATGPGSIVDTIEEEGADGIHLVTVGYGLGNYNDHLMEQLADLGDGFYAYVDDYAEAEQLFGEDLVTTLTPVAAEARTQVTFDPALVTSYRLIGYDNRAIADEDFTDAGTDAGELGAGHHATALYEVRLADGVEPGDAYGTASVRWTPVGTGRTGSDAVQEEASIDLVATDGDPGPSYRLFLAATVADLAQVLKQAAPYADRGVTLEEIRARAQSLADADVAGAEDLVTLVEQAVAAR
jgi:Ca-activated chloride channel homolog